ncbi:MAG: redoxin domain-containing protein [Rhodobacteraceae bacterium]|nr:redoxin domain-containing protein [Paracoccaceae bacterium]
MLYPGNPVPNLVVETVQHGSFDLSQNNGANGIVLIFYRGLHCPLCIRQMTELDAKLDRFTDLGVEVLMISTDGADRAAETVNKAGASKVKVGYGLDLIAARDDWGLWMSSRRAGTSEPDYFNEPGHFYVSPQHVLHFGWVQTAPFARPQLDDISGAVKFALDNSYPPRGIYKGRLPGET